MTDFSIGELARRTGLKVPTIRYYEEIGILPAPPRSRGNQRRYDRAALDRLNFIAHARAMGFPMASVRALLDIAAHPEQPCADLDSLVETRLEEVEHRISGLVRLRSELNGMLESCRHGTVRECRIIAALSDHSRCGPGHLPEDAPAPERLSAP